MALGADAAAGDGGVVAPSIEVPALEVRPEFVLLREAALVVARLEHPASSPAVTGEELLHLRHTQDIINLRSAQLAGVFSATGEAERQGSNCATDWIRHQARMSVGDVLELQVVGTHIDQLPRSGAALEEGRIGFGHLVHLARNAAFAAKSSTGAFDEVPLLPRAEEESVSRFRYTCLNARHAQDPRGYVEAEVNAVESRELAFNEMDDGTTWINARLDNAAAAIARAVLEARSRRLGPDDHRRRARRYADSLVELLQAPLREMEGEQSVGHNVHLNVTCSAATLLNLPGAPAAEIEFGQPISGATVGRLACNASISKILLDDKLVPVSVGHMKRTLSRRERRALNVRDGHCRYPRCQRPPSQCEGHHVEWFSRGGRTRLSNMILLYAVHDWRVHEGGWQLALDGDGAVVVVPPQLFNLARGPGGGIAA